MINYSELTDQGLRRQVAMIAGYRVIEYDESYYLVEPDKTIEQVTRGVDRNFYAYPKYSSYEEAWERSTHYPDYVKNLNACWLLFKAFSLSWGLYTRQDNTYSCEIVTFMQDVIEVTANTPARAMCEAFMKWSDCDEFNPIRTDTER